jgi:hypothetical protein
LIPRELPAHFPACRERRDRRWGIVNPQATMQLEFHQLERCWEHLRVHQPQGQRRLMASLAESGQQMARIGAAVCRPRLLAIAVSPQPHGDIRVTLQGRILRRSCPMTKTQCRTPKVSVGTVKKSIAAMVSRWFLRYVSSRTFGRKGVWSALFPLSHARRFSSKRKPRFRPTPFHCVTPASQWDPVFCK